MICLHITFELLFSKGQMEEERTSANGKMGEEDVKRQQ